MKYINATFIAISIAVVLASCGSDGAAETTTEEVETTEAAAETETQADEAEVTDDAEAEAEADETDTDAAVSTISGDVEVYLIDALDDENNYCIDISGGQADQVDGTEDLQAHTCYSYTGEIAADQVFSVEEIEAGTLFMTMFDVCAEAASAGAGAAIGLSPCDESNELQAFAANGSDQITISLAADETLCVTAATDSRAGGSDIHNIRELTLETCSDDSAAYQTWGFRDGV